MGLNFTEPRNSHGVGRATLPGPEQVFMMWLVEQPADASLLEAAAREAARLEAYAGSHPGPRRLRSMFTALVAELEGPSSGVRKAAPS